MALWTIPTLAETKAQILAVYRALRPNADQGEGSDVDIDSTVLSQAEQRLHRFVRLGFAMLSPMTASGAGTRGWAEFSGQADGYGGYGPVMAQGSTGTDCLRVTATAATGDLQDETLTDTAGRRYKITDSYSFAGAGTHDFDLEAISTGLATNLPSGSVLEFESTPANVEDSATLVSALTGGVDDAEDEDTNALVIDWARDPSLSGNVSHWERWIQDADPGTFDAYVWPIRYNSGFPGTVDYTALVKGQYGADRIVSAGQKSTIEAYILANVPHQMSYFDRFLTVTTQAVDVEAALEITPSASASKTSDFDSQTLAAAVSTWTEGTLTVVADTDVTGSGVPDAQKINVGDVVCIAGAFAEVDTVGVGGDDEFTVATNFETYDADSNPFPWADGYSATGDRITAGGGVILAAHQALQDYFAELVPCQGDYGTASGSDIFRGQRGESEIVRADDDIDACTFTDDSAVTPTDPLDATIPLLIPGELVIEQDYP